MKLRALIAGMSLLGCVVIISFGKTSLAQRSPIIPKENKIQLLEQPCVSSNKEYFRQLKDFPVTSGKQFVTALFVFKLRTNFPSGTLSCKLTARKRFPKETLLLQYGLKDNYAPEVKIKTTIYIDGKPIDEEVLSSGELRTKPFDISNKRSVGIEAVYIGPACCFDSALYIFDAEIKSSSISAIPASDIQNSYSTYSSQPYSILTNSPKQTTPSIDNQNGQSLSDLLNEVQGIRQQINQLFK